MSEIQIVQTCGILFGISLSLYTIWREINSRQLDSYLKLIEYHRSLWKMTMEMDGLDRIREIGLDLKANPPTPKELQFLSFLFLHMTCAYELQKRSRLVAIEQFRADVGELLSMPLPSYFWTMNAVYYNSDFRKFVDNCRLIFNSEIEDARLKSRLSSV